jgi:hypothetical protein
MLLRLCQLKTLLLSMAFVLPGCGFFGQGKDASIELLSMITPEWFAGNPEHALHEPGGGPSPHLFFDVNPEIGEKKNTVNVVVLTPENSPHAYELDMVSGQRFYQHSYCSQPDVWNKRPGNFERPPYSIAILPKALDQLGGPQRVLLFGNHRKFSSHLNSYFHRVRLVGGFLEQICPDVACRNKDNWVSRLIFLAVDAEDSSLDGIKNLDNFLLAYKWHDIQASFENIEGRNPGPEKVSPLNKSGKLISFEDAYGYFKRNSIIFEPKELNKITSGCHKLYNKLWTDVGEWKPEDRPAITEQELKEKVRTIKALRARKLPAGFHARLVQFTKDYLDDIHTCSKFVYPGNINQHPEKFWFLSYMNIFFRLHKEGYFYSCQHKTWQKNIITKDGEPLYNLSKDLERCSAKDIDEAMSYLPHLLKGMKYEKNYFRFIDYDTHSMGSHRKMYSWVKSSNNRFDCEPDPNTPIKQEMKVVPEEVEWVPRFIKDEISKVIF